MAITNATRLAGYVGAAITGNGPDGSISLQETISDSISALRLNVTGVTTSTQGFSGNITGTAATFSGNVTVGGTLTYDDVTNIDSVGLITARNGLQVLAGITTISGQANLANVNVSAGATFADIDINGGNITLGVSGGATDDRIVLGSSPGYLQIYNASGASSVIDGGSANIINKTPDYQVQNAGGDLMLQAANASSVDLYFNASKKFETTGLGVTVFGKTQTQTLNVSGVSTFTGVGFTGFLREGINIISGKLSDNTTINIDHSMVHYFTTAESTTGIPNFTSTAGINTDLSVGETFSVNVITTAAAAGYSTGARIDAGATLPVLWNGGSDPSAGGSAGVDLYNFQVIKTGDATFTILGNVSNFA